MNRKLLTYAGIILLLITLLFSSGCGSRNKIANDPVKWSYVSGDGTWDANSRKWIVYLSPGETKSVLIQLYNSGTQSLAVFTDPEGPFNDHIHPSPQQRFRIYPDVNMILTFEANADTGAPAGSHKYVIDYSNSFYDAKWGLPN